MSKGFAIGAVSSLMGCQPARLQQLSIRHAPVLTRAAIDVGRSYIQDEDVKPGEVIPAMVWAKALDIAALCHGPMVMAAQMQGGGIHIPTLDEVLRAQRLAWEVGR